MVGAWSDAGTPVVSIPLAFSENLGLIRVSFPDSAVSLWTGEIFTGTMLKRLLTLILFIFLFCLVASVFIFAGAPVGYLFGKIRPLKAYTADLLGSLLGIVVFTGVTFFSTSPPVWLAIGALPFIWLSRRRFTYLCFIGVIILGAYSIRGAVYSPYNRIDISKGYQGTILS